MRAHLGKVAVIADVVAYAVLLQVSVDLLPAADRGGHLEGLQDGTAVGLAAADVIHLGSARCFDEGLCKPRYVLAVDVVTHLFALIAEDAVLAPFQVALHQITEKAVQLHAGMVRPGQAATAQAASRHIEVAPVFLHHHIARQLGRAEQRVLGLVNGETLGYAPSVLRIGIIPAGFQFL